ncbi:ubiquinone/menaquinone biosynthesis methyltransferase [Lentzea sp. NPDC058436]|uniref:ubiquinone/menaquinone biosynthesis methyltransferase n=1 Tax=Lentzea sp. NPDC058436 TaxID=3346499 RepID=UPI00365634A8
MVSADMSKDTGTVTTMFDEIAAGYDRTRARMWWGRAEGWSRRTAELAGAGPGRIVLDVAAGTGTSSAALMERGATVVASDISPEMLAVAAQRYPRLTRVVADAQVLPFEDGLFDATTISMGLRNMADPLAALRRMRAVTAPGGRLAVCDFSVPSSRLPRVLWTAYLRHAIPRIGARLGSNPQAYEYFVNTILGWHSPQALGELIREAGWHDVSWHPVDCGIVQIHTAVAR